MRNIILRRPYANSPRIYRHTVVSAEFLYCDGTWHRQDVSGSTPADAYANAIAWQRRCLDPVEVEEANRQHEKFMRDIAIWGCE